MELSERIKSIREAKGVKLTDMANALGVDVSNYAKIEKRGRKLTLERIEEIASVMGVSLQEILGIEQLDQERVEKLESKNAQLKEYLKEMLLIKDKFEGVEKQIVIYDELFRQNRQRSKEVKQWARETVLSLENGEYKSPEKLVNFIRSVYLSDEEPKQ